MAAFHIIGDPDTVLGFRFAGVTGAAVSTEAAARSVLQETLSAQACKILLLTEPVAAWLEKEITEHRLAAAAPFVVVLADIWGTSVSRRSLEELIQEAVGIKIVKSDS